MKNKSIHLFNLIILLVFSILIYSLVKSAHPKQNPIDIVIGSSIDKNASTYLENVPREDQVSLDETVFNNLSGNNKVNVNYRNKDYSVTINRIVPDISTAMSLSNERRDIYIGEDLYDVYKVKADYQQQVSFEPQSNQLQPGKQTITIHYFNQTYTQEVNVYHPNEDPQGVWLSQYDYNKSLSEVVSDYLANRNISPRNVAFVYKNQVTGEIQKMNDTNPMVAASTYKLPLALEVLDAVSEGKVSLNDMTEQGTVQEALDQALIDSSNETAEALISYLGGFTDFYNKIRKYGEGTLSIPTIRYNGNTSTAKYFSNVLDYLYAQQDDYPLLIDDLKQASPTEYYRSYLPDENIIQKYGQYNTAINAVAIRFNATPYTIALFTDNLSLSQFSTLSYIINHWHIVHAG